MKSTPKTLPDLPEIQKSRPSLKQRPFLISRVVLRNPDSKGGDEKKLKLCKKCESMTIGMNRDSIHSTLAYSRCRCHRHFKYRKRTQESLSPASEDQTVPNLHGGKKLGASNRGIKLEPLNHLPGPMGKTEDVPKVKHRRALPISTSPLVGVEDSSRPVRNDTAGDDRTKDGVLSGCALPLLSAVSIVSKKLPVGSVVEFSGSSVLRY